MVLRPTNPPPISWCVPALSRHYKGHCGLFSQLLPTVREPKYISAPTHPVTPGEAKDYLSKVHSLLSTPWASPTTVYYLLLVCSVQTLDNMLGSCSTFTQHQNWKKSFATVFKFTSICENVLRIFTRGCNVKVYQTKLHQHISRQKKNMELIQWIWKSTIFFLWNHLLEGIHNWKPLFPKEAKALLTGQKRIIFGWVSLF